MFSAGLPVASHTLLSRLLFMLAHPVPPPPPPPPPSHLIPSKVIDGRSTLSVRQRSELPETKNTTESSSSSSSSATAARRKGRRQAGFSSNLIWYILFFSYSTFMRAPSMVHRRVGGTVLSVIACTVATEREMLTNVPRIFAVGYLQTSIRSLHQTSLQRG